MLKKQQQQQQKTNVTRRDVTRRDVSKRKKPTYVTLIETLYRENVSFRDRDLKR